MSFPEAFLRWAATAPSQVAVEFEGRQVSYGELAAWSGRLAVELRGRGGNVLTFRPSGTPGAQCQSPAPCTHSGNCQEVNHKSSPWR